MQKVKIENFYKKIMDNTSRVIFGKHKQIEIILLCIVCNGHVLLEDIPGTGKTYLAKTFAKSLGGQFRRIQFTPDMLPSDIVGVSIYNQAKKIFEFKPGPIFCDFLLADEINRATPKAQSALLEAMEERQVTVDGITRHISKTFIVFATQNPIEYEGTFPLPEAQLDRFFMKTELGYPSQKYEMAMLDSQRFSHPFNCIEQVSTLNELENIQEEIRKVYVSDLIKNYIHSLVQATREHADIFLGASPRASLALYRAGQAMAAFRSRSFVIPEDILEVIKPVLIHRIIVKTGARIQELSSSDIIEEIVNNTVVPGGTFSE